MLLRLTSTRSGSFLFILNRVSSTSVELGSSSGTGLYWVHWITPTTHLQNTLSCTAGDCANCGLNSSYCENSTHLNMFAALSQHVFIKSFRAPILSRRLIAWDSVNTPAYSFCQTKQSIVYCSWKYNFSRQLVMTLNITLDYGALCWFRNKLSQSTEGHVGFQLKRKLKLYIYKITKIHFQLKFFKFIFWCFNSSKREQTYQTTLGFCIFQPICYKSCIFHIYADHFLKDTTEFRVLFVYPTFQALDFHSLSKNTF